MKRILILACIIVVSLNVNATEKKNQTKKQKGYVFTDVISLPTTSVKDQYRSGTCWSYSGISFLESELLRMGKGEHDLSEMYVVRKSYEEKGKKYVRLHGHLNFAIGGAFNDVTDCSRNFGVIPEEAYTGLTIGEEGPVTGEMDKVLKGYLDGVITNPNKKLTPVWFKGLSSLFDAYLGEVPQTFTYQGKEYTPESFAKDLGLDMNNYIMVSSYNHHEFYKPFVLEVPDNWAWGEVYNLPINEFMSVVDNSIESGYTIGWASDVSEKGYSWSRGVAIVPDEANPDRAGMEQDKWEKMTAKSKVSSLYSFSGPVKEKVITQELRQVAFDNYQSTDDHGMHIVGKATDQNGKVYYKVKNSWNTTNIYKGYLYVSEAFIAYKTTNILINKNALPKDIKTKLGL